MRGDVIHVGSARALMNFAVSRKRNRRSRNHTALELRSYAINFCSVCRAHEDHFRLLSLAIANCRLEWQSKVMAISNIQLAIGNRQSAMTLAYVWDGQEIVLNQCESPFQTWSDLEC